MSFRMVPALYCAVAFCIGCALFHSCSLALALCATAFLIISRKLLLCAPLLLGIFWAAFFAPPEAQEMNLSGTFIPTRCTPTQLPFGQGHIVYGTLENYPVSILLLKRKNLPIDGTYHMSGTLKPGKGSRHLFKTTQWDKITGSHSLVGVRYRLKQKIKTYIRKQIPNTHVGDFIAAILCGELEDRHMRYYFSEVGLSHVLAISGLHFGMIIMLLTPFLRMLLPYRILIPLLFLAINTYAWLLGDSPSVLRACLMLDVALIGKMLGRYSTPINLVGTAGLIELLIFPHHIMHLSFMMTYTATLSILIFYPPFYRLTGRLFRSRTRYEIEQFSPLGSFEFFLCSHLRKLIAVAGAVHLTMAFITMAHFGSFPLISLFYNLFIPLMLFVTLGAALLGLALGPLGMPLHCFNAVWTGFMLDLVRYPPPCIQLRASWVTPQLALVIVTVLFLWRISNQ